MPFAGLPRLGGPAVRGAGEPIVCMYLIASEGTQCFLESGAPGEIRTPDPVLRRHVLYPSELRARGKVASNYAWFRRMSPRPCEYNRNENSAAYCQESVLERTPEQAGTELVFGRALIFRAVRFARSSQQKRFWFAPCVWS